MADRTTTRATLLYTENPVISDESLHAALAVIAGKHGLPVSGEFNSGEQQMRMVCAPYEITVEVHPDRLGASSFVGAISGNPYEEQRADLAAVVAEHCAYADVAVRYLGTGQDLREMILPSSEIGVQDYKRAMVFTQDIVRTVAESAPAAAIHWHTPNLLSPASALNATDFGRLNLPLCLRLNCTSSALPDSSVANMAQEIVGAEEYLAKPLHVMALSLGRPDIMRLAVAFLDRMLEGEARPIGGAIFRDQTGARVKVMDIAPNSELPKGLIALVEVDPDEKPSRAPAAPKTPRSKTRVRSRDLKELRAAANARSAAASANRPEKRAKAGLPTQSRD